MACRGIGLTAPWLSSSLPVAPFAAFALSDAWTFHFSLFTIFIGAQQGLSIILMDYVTN